MIKRYCDTCGSWIDGDGASKQRVKVKKGRIEVEVMVGLDGTWNGGDVCRDCVLFVLAPEGGDVAALADQLQLGLGLLAHDDEKGAREAILGVIRELRHQPAPSVASTPQEGEPEPEFWWSRSAAMEDGFGLVPRNGLIERHHRDRNRFCIHGGVGWTVVDELPADAIPLRLKDDQ